MFKRKILKVKECLSSFAIVFGIIYIGSDDKDGAGL
mgnify:CR=1 FL=1